MAAIGKVYQEHMIIAYGGGANGKSTFWNTIFRVLGNYAGNRNKNRCCSHQRIDRHHSQTG